MFISNSALRGSLIYSCIALQFGCSSDTTGADVSGSTPLLPSISQFDPPETQAGPTLDEVFAGVSLEVPSFGGIFTDADGAVVIQLTDTLEAETARSVVLRVFGSEPTIHGRNIRVKLAHYTFSQLHSWLASVLASGVPEGVRTSDVDERANVVRIGVADAATRELLQGRVREARIPEDALVTSEIAPIRQQTDYLGSAMRPVIGGLTIVTTYGGCSLGFKAKISTVRYVVTNSHCTSTFGADNNDGLGQPLLQSNYFIGTEYSDPAFSSGGGCSSGHNCRYSDAALFQCDTLSHCFGYTIAQTTSEYTGANWNESGSLELTTEPWYVTAELSNSSLTQGMSISKVGATSGWTGATVDQTCITIYNAGGQNNDLLCQYAASYVSRSGDSGSPVFTYDSSQGTAALAGIHHSAGGGYSYFSTIGGVKTDLGSMTVSSLIH
jgi:hypothetical protein